MRSASSVRVSKLLVILDHWNQADRKAPISLVYDELRSLARRHPRRERPNRTLRSPTLVHKAYVRLIFKDPPQLRNQAQLFGVVTELKQSVLVDRIRNRLTVKREWSTGRAWLQ
jgi:hypothetical protein